MDNQSCWQCGYVEGHVVGCFETTETARKLELYLSEASTEVCAALIAWAAKLRAVGVEPTEAALTTDREKNPYQLDNQRVGTHATLTRATAEKALEVLG